MNRQPLEAQAPQEAGETDEVVGAAGVVGDVVPPKLNPEARSAWDLKDNSVDV
jgi:hypothetical protein